MSCFGSSPNESLKNIPFEVESLTHGHKMTNLHVLTAEKKTKRSNIQVKNKRQKYYYPLGVYSVSVLDKIIKNDM